MVYGSELFQALLNLSKSTPQLPLGKIYQSQTLWIRSHLIAGQLEGYLAASQRKSDTLQVTAGPRLLLREPSLFGLHRLDSFHGQTMGLFPYIQVIWECRSCLGSCGTAHFNLPLNRDKILLNPLKVVSEHATPLSVPAHPSHEHMVSSSALMMQIPTPSRTVQPSPSTKQFFLDSRGCGLCPVEPCRRLHKFRSSGGFQAL